MNRPLIIIAGPTAAGKTNLSVNLAKRINGACISADSMQVYKYMDIGSAKISKDEMNGIKHYGIDILEPTEDYNVNLFQKMAKEAISDCYDNNKIPIIVGGTGFYIQSVLYDIEFDETEKNNDYRNELIAISNEKGSEYLHEMLLEIDPDSYNLIHPNNTKRVIRALEYYKETGNPISKHNEIQSKKESPYNNCYFVLYDERETLYKRIDLRVDKMIKSGLIDEVKKLKDMGLQRENVSMQGLGYKEILDYLDGFISLEDAIETVKRETRRFAKRQLTWFRREKDTYWINKSEYSSEDEILEYILSVIEEKNIWNRI